MSRRQEMSASGDQVMIKTLVVPSVQEMVSNKDPPLTVVPPRYVQPQPFETAVHVAPDNDDPSFRVPVIDLESLFKGDPLQLHNLHSACKYWGFFLAVNHGVSGSLIESFKREAKALFELPMEEKKRLWQTPEQSEGFGQTFVVSEEQKLDWSDAFFLNTLPPTLRKPHLFRKLPPQLKDTMESYVAEVQNLAEKIVALLEQALRGAGNNDTVAIMYEGVIQGLRINYYPACPEPHKVNGTSPHSDANAITLLLQLNEIDGLQIRKDGRWIPIHPLPQSFIVNVGDMMEIMSNGIYRSVEHRVVVNPDKERMTVATFHSPGPEHEIGPLSSLIGPGNPARFGRITTLQYLKGFFARKLEGKRYLDVLRIDHGPSC